MAVFDSEKNNSLPGEINKMPLAIIVTYSYIVVIRDIIKLSMFDTIYFVMTDFIKAVYLEQHLIIDKVSLLL